MEVSGCEEGVHMHVVHAALIVSTGLLQGIAL
jgi:hypothetical protein